MANTLINEAPPTRPGAGVQERLNEMVGRTSLEDLQLARNPKVIMQELMAASENGRGIVLWTYLTCRPMTTVMSPGYFDRAGTRLRVFDRVFVTANILTKPEHATLVVVEAAANGGINNGPMCRVERAR